MSREIRSEYFANEALASNPKVAPVMIRRKPRIQPKRRTSGYRQGGLWLALVGLVVLHYLPTFFA